jgi:D-3-phosphoglycerate dehydrogenase
MVKPLVVKAGSEAPDPVTGMTYPIPKSLEKLRAVARILVTEDENEQTLIDAAKGATVLMITYGRVSEAVIKAGMPTLKAVVKMGTGIDSIDFEAAKANNVRVTNCPGYAKYAVAENAFMLMINCLKKFNMMRDAVQKSGWLGATEDAKGAELYGKTVGLIGFGHINTGFTRMCQGFGMTVQAYDPYVDERTMKAKSVSKINDLDTLAETSDVVVICVPLNPETHHIIDAKFLNRMKPSAIIINVGRGATVDELALLEALKSNRIAGCGLDVFSQEPLNKVDHPLKDILSMPNVVISPHLAAWTVETWDRLQDEVTTHVQDILAGRPLTIRSNDPRLAGQTGCVYENG